MSCSSLQGVTYSLCDGNIGGISKIYLANIDDITAINTGETSGETGEVVTSIEMASGATFYEFTIRKNTSSFNSELTVNDNGSKFVTSTLAFTMPRMDSAKRAAMQSLVMAEAIGIIRDSNGKMWVLGDLNNPLDMSAGTAETGTAKSDANQYSVELSAETSEFPMVFVGEVPLGD